MKRLLLVASAVAALAGTAAATAAAPTVTLTQDRRTVFFGGTITLSGDISPAAANQKVTITQDPQDRPARTTEAMTQADGSFSLDVQPRIQTTAQAKFQTAQSEQLIMFVRPRVGLRKFGARRFGVTVVAGRSFVGNYVWVSRWDRSRHQWRNIKRVYLTRYVKSTGASTAAFSLRVRRSTKLRAFLSAPQARPGYLNSYSNFIVAR
ncbi:MAG TPA: hypothetical protein VE688_01545 [Gaiellaceae bacterium]|jgi:hypothetical protein|nr:hypothetical protein [Gaiellaceae bacterium]